MNEEKII